jgi:hypothetical protein
MPSWAYTAGGRVGGSVAPVTIFGVQLQDKAAKSHFDGAFTRHHLIDIQVLQKIWNAFVAADDEESMAALITWAGGAMPARPFNMNSTAAPQGLLNRIAWNPFNIVIGPLANYRVNDPGSTFDAITFTSFPKFDAAGDANQKESLARQEFNTHIYRLRQIYLLMKEYLTHDDFSPQAVSSLRSLLRSDTVNSYPHLSQLGKTRRRGDPTVLFMDRALLHPALWQDYSLTADRWFNDAADQAKYAKALSMKVAPYVNRSMFNDIYVKPKDQNASLREDLKSPPTSSPLTTIPTSDRRVFDAAALSKLLEEKIGSHQRFATGTGVRVLICAKKEDGLFRDLSDNVGRAVRELVAKNKTWKVTYSPMARPEYSATEVRLYWKN